MSFANRNVSGLQKCLIIRFQNEYNKAEIELHVVQFWTEIKLVKSNKLKSNLFDFSPNCTPLSSINWTYNLLPLASYYYNEWTFQTFYEAFQIRLNFKWNQTAQNAKELTYLYYIFRKFILACIVQMLHVNQCLENIGERLLHACISIVM